MDVAASWDIRNPFGLRSRDFDDDTESYRVALAFLSDLAGGSDEAQALELNGANPAMVVMWSKSARFRRVLDKCRRGAESEREALARREAQDAAGEPWRVAPGEQRFIALEDMPSQRRSLFQAGFGV